MLNGLYGTVTGWQIYHCLDEFLTGLTGIYWAYSSNESVKILGNCSIK